MSAAITTRLVLALALVAIVLPLPVAHAGPMIRWHLMKVRHLTYQDADHNCQSKADELQRATHEVVVCEDVYASPAKRRRAQRAVVDGQYEVQWRTGPNKGMTFLYYRVFYWQWRGFRHWQWRHNDWTGP